MPIVGVVADANVLLSAVVGKAALRVFTASTTVVHVAQYNADEVSEYLPLMARKYHLTVELVEMQWKLLPMHLYPMATYQDQFHQALTDMQDRDPDDAHVLALARSLDLPIWSNDRDLQGQDIECYPTARLLRLLEL